jgi:DNA-binding protein HU-beta
MNKSDLIDFLAENHQMSRAEARRIVGDLFGAIVKTVKGGDSVVISGFGTFRLHAREARLGVDPVSRARFQIPPVKVPKFVPGVGFRAEVDTAIAVRRAPKRRLINTA